MTYMTKLGEEAAGEIERLEAECAKWRALASDWTVARVATCEAGVGHKDYMARLAALSEAEDAMAKMAMEIEK